MSAESGRARPKFVRTRVKMGPLLTRALLTTTLDDTSVVIPVLSSSENPGVGGQLRRSIASPNPAVFGQSRPTELPARWCRVWALADRLSSNSEPGDHILCGPYPANSGPNQVSLGPTFIRFGRNVWRFGQVLARYGIAPLMALCHSLGALSLACMRHKTSWTTIACYDLSTTLVRGIVEPHTLGDALHFVHFGERSISGDSERSTCTRDAPRWRDPFACPLAHILSCPLVHPLAPTLVCLFDTNKRYHQVEHLHDAHDDKHTTSRVPAWCALAEHGGHLDPPQT